MSQEGKPDEKPRIVELNALMLSLYKRDLIQPMKGWYHGKLGKIHLNPDSTILLKKNVFQHEPMLPKSYVEYSNRLVDDFIMMCKKRYGEGGEDKDEKPRNGVSFQRLERVRIFNKAFEKQRIEYETKARETYEKRMMELFKKTFTERVLRDQVNVEDITIVPYFGESDPCEFSLEEAFLRNLKDSAVSFHEYPPYWIKEEYDLIALHGSECCKELMSERIALKVRIMQERDEKEKEKEMQELFQNIPTMLPLTQNVPRTQNVPNLPRTQNVPNVFNVEPQTQKQNTFGTMPPVKGLPLARIEEEDAGNVKLLQEELRSYLDYLKEDELEDEQLNFYKKILFYLDAIQTSKTDKNKWTFQFFQYLWKSEYKEHMKRDEELCTLYKLLKETIIELEHLFAGHIMYNSMFQEIRILQQLKESLGINTPNFFPNLLPSF